MDNSDSTTEPDRWFLSPLSHSSDQLHLPLLLPQENAMPPIPRLPSDRKQVRGLLSTSSVERSHILNLEGPLHGNPFDPKH